MNWDAEDRGKLLKALREKRSSLLDECYSSKVFRRRWNEFLDSHGIDHVSVVDPVDSRFVKLKDAHGLIGMAGRVFSVPKDVAEKFLVLGIP